MAKGSLLLLLAAGDQQAGDEAASEKGLDGVSGGRVRRRSSAGERRKAAESEAEPLRCREKREIAGRTGRTAAPLMGDQAGVAAKAAEEEEEDEEGVRGEK